MSRASPNPNANQKSNACDSQHSRYQGPFDMRKPPTVFDEPAGGTSWPDRRTWSPGSVSYDPPIPPPQRRPCGHPSLVETYRVLVNRHLRDVIADMDVISTAECLSLALPAGPDRTPHHRGPSWTGSTGPHDCSIDPILFRRLKSWAFWVTKAAFYCTTKKCDLISQCNMWAFVDVSG